LVGVGVCVTGVVVIVGVIDGVTVLVGVGVWVTWVGVTVGVGLGIGFKQQDLKVIIVKFLVGVGVIVGVLDGVILGVTDIVGVLVGVGVMVEVGQGCGIPIPIQSDIQASQLKPYPPFT
jgi:hypothetical protein